MFKYKNRFVHYEDNGNKNGNVIVYLHGWGQNIQMMEPIAKPFYDTHRVIIIDFPGFGQSEEPEYAWTLEEYAECIHTLLHKFKIDNEKAVFIGHSFGGKVSIVYALKFGVKKLILLASPYKVKIKKPSKKVLFLKKIAKVPGFKTIANNMKMKMGSTDYRNASPIMRDILVKHVNTDLTDKVKNIKVPTLLIWGTLDDAVPIEDARELEKLIDNCGLVEYEGCTHYAYLERLGQTIRVLKSFID